MVEVDRHRTLAGNEQRIYRGHSTRGIAAVLAFVGLLLLLEGIQVVAGSRGDNAHVVVGSIWIGFTIVCFAWSLRFASMGVVATEKGIRVRNYFRSYEFTWNSISKFAFGNEVEDLGVRELLSSPILLTYVVLKSGSHVAMSGIQATRLNRKRSRARVKAILGELEAEKRGFESSDA